jgi:hypothetical protein
VTLTVASSVNVKERMLSEIALYLILFFISAEQEEIE